MAKCSYANCDIKTDCLLYHIDNGKEKIIFCSNHSILFATNEISEDKIKKYPSELPENTDLHCEICGEEGYEFKEHKYSLKLCKKHIQKILKHSLSPGEFFILYEKYPDMFLLHDDFYNPKTGTAFQPIEIE